MYSRYSIEHKAWFICIDMDVICKRLYGPFDKKELELAKQIHGVNDGIQTAAFA